MNDKVNRMLLVCGLAVILAGCGQAEPAGNLAQNITMGSSAGQESTGKEDGGESAEKQDKGEAVPETAKEEGPFGFLYEGITLIPGEIFDSSSLKDYTEVSEVPSCAFEGNDRVYNYEAFELTAYIDGETERIYSIYLLDPNQRTAEGLGFGDSMKNMTELYGENYEAVGNSYVYTREDTALSFIIQNDMIIGIEYRLNR